jgi:hypothetical protein
VLTGIRPPISVPPERIRASWSPSLQNPVSAMCMSSAPDSVSCNWATSMSSGPMPAASKAAAAASTVGPATRSGDSQGLNTSKDPNRRVRNDTAFRCTGVSV